MQKIKTKLFLIIALTILLLIWIIFEWPDNYTRVIFCDVGQGDAILISQKFRQIIIDSGPNNDISLCLKRYIPFWDKKIELAVATHADNDHIGGFETVLNEFFVEKMIITKLGKKTQSFLRFRDLILREKEQGMELILLEESMSLQFDESIHIKSLLPRVDGSTGNPFAGQNTETMLWDQIAVQEQWLESQAIDLNALSIVNIVTIGNIRVLLTGDLYVEGEQALIKQGLIKDVDILKVGHHGSKTSTSDELLVVSQPEISIISVGKSNTYRHPNPQVLAKLEDFGTHILRTDQMGDIVFVTNEQSYWIE